LPTSTPSVNRRAVAALVVLFAASLPAVTPRIYASDEIEYFAYLRSLWFDHDLSFDNEYRYFYDRGIAKSPGFHETFLERTTDTGRRVNFATIGCAVVWAPFYAAGELTARLMRRAGMPVEADGFSPPYIAAVSYGSAVSGFLALLLSLAAARRVIPAGQWPAGGWLAEAAPALFVWMGTPLLFYMYVAPPMSHAVSALVASGFVLTWLVVRRDWSVRGVAALGALAALMAMVREQDAFVAAGPALDIVWTLLARPRAGRLRWATVRAATGLCTLSIVYAPQAAAYVILNGHVGPSPLVARKMTWWAPHALQVLGSPEHGLLLWTPLAALALAGLVVLASTGTRKAPAAGALESDGGTADRRQVAICLLAIAAVQIFVAGSVESWTVAGAFGQRRFVVLTVLLVIGVAAALARTRTVATRTVLLLALVCCTWWNVGLALQFGTGLMDRQRLELGRNAFTNFVVLPRALPGLAHRYLFDRTSFYGDRTTR
jgi:hypothetical protein